MDRANPPSSAQNNQYQVEHARIAQRRDLLGLARKGTGHWALALSGGGIRSATFCLGVLQALARAKAPDAIDEAGQASEPSGIGKRLLAHFDYLSTVSGGGYIGSFFGSLFMPDRLRKREGQHEAVNPQIQAAEEAYEVLDYEPPGRISTSTDFVNAPVGAAPLAWLRENGRYLTPNGSGDLFYLLALSLRNLLSVHFVIGMPLLCVLTLAMLVQNGISSLGQCEPNDALCNSLWWLPGVVIMGVVVPLMQAFWMVYPEKSPDDKVRPWNCASSVYAVTGIVLFAMAIGFSSAHWTLSYDGFWACVERPVYWVLRPVSV